MNQVNTREWIDTCAPDEIRDALLELIEAATALVDSQGGPWERGNAYISARGAENMNASMKKTRAAIARVQGGAA